jgi:lactoylglutathione lyase
MKKIIGALLSIVVVTLSLNKVSAQSDADIAVSLNHIAVYVSNLEKSTTFYETILKLKQIPEPFHDGKHTWFTIGSAGHIHLVMGEPKEYARDRNDHLCFSVKSVEAFITNLNNYKIEYTNWPGTAKEVTVRKDGVKQIYFKDPDGHLIEINDDTSVVK